MAKKKKSKDPKCSCQGCSLRVSLAQQEVGRCNKCTGVFCLQHRLPESHQCFGKTSLTEEEKKVMVQSMRCVAAKV